MFSNVVHVVAHNRISFRFKVEECAIVCHILFIHSFVHGHLSHFSFVAVVNNAMDFDVQVSS